MKKALVIGLVAVAMTGCSSMKDIPERKTYAQAAEEQMDAIAMNNFAKRINGTVNSETVIDIKDDKKTTRTMISYKVTDTAIRKHVKTEKGHFTMNGRHYTYVRLEMKKSTFEQLVQEAQAKRAQ